LNAEATTTVSADPGRDVEVVVPGLDGEGAVVPVPTGDALDATRLEVLPEGVTLEPTLRRSVDLSSDVRDPILSGLRGVVNEEAGTAYRAFAGFSYPGFPIAGKTGTAQRSKKHDFSLFVGFGGPNNRFVVCVIVEEAGFGSAVAAPVARRIFDGLAGIDGGEVDYIVTGTQDR
jgi:Penicillin binding protein transpeptidase domain